MTDPITPNPIPRRSILKAAGVALAGLGLPVGRATAGTTRAAHRSLILPIAVEIEYEVWIRGPQGRGISPTGIAAIGYVNSERFLNFKPGVVLFSGIRREVDSDGITSEEYKFLAHPEGWNRNGLVPSYSPTDLNRLYPGDTPKEYRMTVRADTYRMDGRGERSYIGSQETDCAVNDYTIIQTATRNYCA